MSSSRESSLLATLNKGEENFKNKFGLNAGYDDVDGTMDANQLLVYAQRDENGDLVSDVPPTFRGQPERHDGHIPHLRKHQEEQRKDGQTSQRDSYRRQ